MQIKMELCKYIVFVLK